MNIEILYGIVVIVLVQVVYVGVRWYVKVWKEERVRSENVIKRIYIKDGNKSCSYEI